MVVDVNKKVEGTLVGCNPNAFAILGHFKRLASKQGWSLEEIKAVKDEAMDGDYNHLLNTINERMEG